MTAFRQTSNDPQVYMQTESNITGMGNSGGIDMVRMEEALARTLAQQKQADERRRREIERICVESDELKELQMKIKAAYLNKERSQQMAEKQFRAQQEIEEDAQMDMVILRNKEIKDKEERDQNMNQLAKLQNNRKELQKQIDEAAQLRDEAYQEYLREKEQVDAVVQRMISEDNEQMRINQQKKEQSQADMILSMNEKRALMKRQKEMDEYENEMVRRYSEQQQARADAIAGLKAEAEAVRDKIFQRLEAEENQRRAEAEFQENLRNELYWQEGEEAAQAREKAEADKRVRVREELQAAKDYQIRLKAERAEEEKRMEDEFKRKLMEKFAEDERLEQMNAQRRRMREQEHKRQVQMLWQEKQKILEQQRLAEEAEQQAKKAAEQQERDIIEQQKRALLEEHAAILQLHHPKATGQYKGAF